MEMNQIEEKVDVSTLSLDQVNDLSAHISSQLRDIIDEAADKINKILSVYGSHAKIAIAFDNLDSKEVSKKLENTPIRAPKRNRK